jgi:Cof subfamily protein (haloacid dehalogenase superfamily)
VKDNFPKDTSRFKLIVSDFDGTLTSFNHQISQKVKTAVKRWIDSGNFFTIATGRQFAMIKGECRDMNITTPVIVRGGAEIIDSVSGRVLFEELIDEKTIKELFQVFNQNKINFLVEKGNVLFLNFNYPLDFPTVVKKNLEEFTIQKAPKMAVKAYDEDFEKVSKIMKEIQKTYPNLSIHRTHNLFGFGWDITSQRATKLYGIIKVMEILGLKKDETAGLGDSYNDFPLLEAAGLKVAMGNAHPELKEIADITVPSNEEDGVAYLINQLLK